MTTPDPNQPKGTSFKHISDLLNMDGSAGFDDASAEKELAELEARKRQVDDFKNKLAEFNKITNVDDYMGSILRELVSKGMAMLDAIQHEVEDSAKGRDVETAAAMITALNSLIDNMNSIKVSNAKISIEQQKLDLKKSSSAGANITANQNILMVATPNELMDFLLSKNLIPDNNKIKEVEVIPPKEEKQNGGE